MVVDGETGFLVEEENTSAMAGRIAHLSARPELWTKLGRTGRIRVQNEFNIDTQVQKLKRLYADVLPGKVNC